MQIPSETNMIIYKNQQYLYKNNKLQYNINILSYFLRWGMYSSGNDVPNKAIPVMTLDTAQALAQSSTKTAFL